MAGVSQALAILSALMMAISFAIWSGWLRGPLLERLDGQRASNAAPATLAYIRNYVAQTLGKS